MIPNAVDYPVFEANQVLTNEHLNNVRTYLDEQSRLTRANLHGIGVVCGLEVSVSGTVNHKTVTLSKGYGVTSEGYLAVIGNENFSADKRLEYKAPAEEVDIYFTDEKGVNRYDLWELAGPSHDDYDDGVQLTEAFLKDKVVLLYVELRKEALKNCSPSSCDDKGSRVNVALRKLLISKSNLLKLHNHIQQKLAEAKATGDFFPDLTGRIGLPDLRLPRLDVPGTSMVDGNTIFSAYRKILAPPFTQKTIFDRVGEALDEAYEVFQPVLETLPSPDFLSQKITDAKNSYAQVLSTDSVIFSQYYYDLLDDLIQAYEEFRWKATELMALCAPPRELFPRHLELGEIEGANFAGHKEHRHYFRPSPALAEQKKLGEEVRLLFRRLREMVASFEPPKKPSSGQTIKNTVKITPSRLGDHVLSEKAIPYYYRLGGASELLQNWNYFNTKTGRPNLNHGYRVDTKYHRYPDAKPLEYDLEPYNFFRIEGHVGFPWRGVLEELLENIRNYRLPFDVVALNAHPSTVEADVLNDPLIARCLTNDLQVMYDAWLSEFNCLLSEKTKLITNFQIASKQPKGPVKPGAAFVSAATAGAFLSSRPTAAKINIFSAVATAEGTLGNVIATAAGAGTSAPATGQPTAQPVTAVNLKENVTTLLKDNPEVTKLSVAEYDLAIGKRLDVVTAMANFANAIPANAGELKYQFVNDNYIKLNNAIRDYIDILVAYDPPVENPVITPAEKDLTVKELRSLLSSCLFKQLEKIGAELERRKKEVEELIFFSKYIRKHPGIQHKAGVPKGGTFVLVFHEIPAGEPKPGTGSFSAGTLTADVTTATAGTVTTAGSGPAINTGGFTLAQAGKTRPLTIADIDIIKANLSQASINLTPAILTNLGNLVIGEITKEKFNIGNNVVIADFFLPYRCCSDCPPVQFILPPPRPIFEITIGCADPNGNAPVTLEFAQGTPPFEYKLDDAEEFERLPEDLTFMALAGTHTIVVRDGEGGVSLPNEFEVLPHFIIELEEPVCQEGNETFTVRLRVTNGRLPFSIDGNEVQAEPDANDPKVHYLTAGPFPSGQMTKFEFRDNSPCPPESLQVEHTCISLSTTPDEATTDPGQAVEIPVLANDAGNSLQIVDAVLADPTLGQVIVNNGTTLTFKPADGVSKTNVEITYTVKDSSGQTATEKVLVHVTCGLPCDGKALNCGYRLWLQPLNENPDVQYRQYEGKIGKLVVGNQDLTDGAPPINASEVELNTKFNETVGQWVKAINDYVAEKIGAQGHWFLTYEPNQGAPFPILRIEHFNCDAYKSVLQVEGRVRMSGQGTGGQRPFNVIYTNKGTDFNANPFGDQKPYLLPPFDCIDLDKCNDKSVARCENAGVKASFDFQLTGNAGNTAKGKLTGKAQNQAGGNITWRWEGQDAEFVNAAAQETEVTFSNIIRGQGQKQVKLIVIDSKGCMGFAVQTINVLPL